MARFRNCNILLGHLRSGLNVGLLVLGVLTILGRVSLTGFLVYFAVLACWAVLTGVAYRPLLLRYADRFSVRLMGSGKALANGLLKIAMRNGNAEAVSRHPRMLRLLST
jgi:Zn-dependent protease with chaperone function